jgi:hypothetical protein
VILPKIEPDSEDKMGRRQAQLSLTVSLPRSDPMSCAAWKVSELNLLFQDQGVLGQLGKITPETVLHGKQTNRFVEKRQSWEGKT